MIDEAEKLLGFDRGVTLLGGFPFPICAPAHGTAYDIAGQGTAKYVTLDHMAHRVAFLKEHPTCWQARATHRARRVVFPIGKRL